MGDVNRKQIERIINNIEQNGFDLEMAILELKSNKNIESYIDLLELYSTELTRDGKLNDMPNAAKWLKIQWHLIRLLRIFVDCRS